MSIMTRCALLMNSQLLMPQAGPQKSAHSSTDSLLTGCLPWQAVAAAEQQLAKIKAEAAIKEAALEERLAAAAAAQEVRPPIPASQCFTRRRLWALQGAGCLMQCV